MEKEKADSNIFWTESINIEPSILVLLHYFVLAPMVNNLRSHYYLTCFLMIFLYVFGYG